MIEPEGMTRRAALAGLLLPAFAAEAGSEAGDPAFGSSLVTAARRQIGVTRGYDSGYSRIAYPGGDVPRATGVCADVIIRAFRDAGSIDLQQRVHEDMQRAFDVYPRRWRLRAPDANIDHRRVPNLETYFARHGAALWQAGGRRWGVDFAGALQPGDILTWRSFHSGRPHIGLVSRGGPWPSIIHNQGWGAREEWLAGRLLDRANGHFRWPSSHAAGAERVRSA